jgi:pilus assembly protein CpaF
MSFDLILPFLRPIERLLLDESVSEIMGNPDSTWWYERDGIVSQEAGVQFDAAKLRTGLEVIANHLGKRLDEDNPLCMPSFPMEAASRPSFRRLFGLLRRSRSGSSRAADSPSMT